MPITKTHILCSNPISTSQTESQMKILLPNLFFRRHTPHHSPNHNQIGVSRPPRTNRRFRIRLLHIIYSPRLTVTTTPDTPTNPPLRQKTQPPSFHPPKRRNSIPIKNVQKHIYPLRRTKSEHTLAQEHNDITPAISMIPFEARHNWKDPITLCAICRDLLCTSPTCTKTHIRELPCLHRFHANCIYGPTKWMPKHSTCPMCRKTAHQLHLPGLLKVQNTLMQNQN